MREEQIRPITENLRLGIEMNATSPDKKSELKFIRTTNWHYQLQVNGTPIMSTPDLQHFHMKLYAINLDKWVLTCKTDLFTNFSKEL